MAHPMHGLMFINTLLRRSFTRTLAIHLSFVALKSEPGHTQADQRESDQRFPLSPVRFVLSRSHDPERELGQMIRWQEMCDLLHQLRQEHDGDPEPGTKR